MSGRWWGTIDVTMGAHGAWALGHGPHIWPQGWIVMDGLGVF